MLPSNSLGVNSQRTQHPVAAIIAFLDKWASGWQIAAPATLTSKLSDGSAGDTGTYEGLTGTLLSTRSITVVREFDQSVGLSNLTFEAWVPTW